MPMSDRLARILAAPHLERLVPRLQPELLHQLVQRRGLEDCADIVAHATPHQLARVFDLDLWRGTPGGDEALDAGRFGVWLEVLVESGAAAAAAKLTAMDVDLVIAGLAAQMRVFDHAAVDRPGFEIGGYLVEPARTAPWDTIAELLLHLQAEHHDYFTRVMSGCRRLSNEGFEDDGLDDLLLPVGQARFDLACGREERRERDGFVSPAQGRAFLQLARVRPREDAVLEANPIAAAYVRGLGRVPGLVHAQLDIGSDRAQEELAFVANALMAGCSIDGRAFTPGEASQAAAATCSLGAGTSSTRRDVVSAFEIGWTLLYREVCLAAAMRLVDVLGDVRPGDRSTRLEVDSLRSALRRATREGEPWRAREALDAIMVLDMTAWAALRALIAECPVVHAAMRAGGAHTVGASDFEFIAADAQLASVREFLARLPSALAA